MFKSLPEWVGNVMHELFFQFWVICRVEKHNFFLFTQTRIKRLRDSLKNWGVWGWRDNVSNLTVFKNLLPRTSAHASWKSRHVAVCDTLSIRNLVIFLKMEMRLMRNNLSSDKSCWFLVRTKDHKPSAKFIAARFWEMDAVRCAPGIYTFLPFLKIF